MADENYRRKLTGILRNDVAGYSRLIGDDEMATVCTLKSHRNLFSEKVQAFHVRVVDSSDDNILAEFRSIVDSVSCAVEIQHVLKEKNDELSAVPGSFPKLVSNRFCVKVQDIDNRKDLYGPNTSRRPNFGRKSKNASDPKCFEYFGLMSNQGSNTKTF